MDLSAPKTLWTPSKTVKETANLTRYMHWLKQRDLHFEDYQSLWEWSVNEVGDFWESLFEYFGVKSHTPYTEVMSADPMPHTHWFPGTTLNFAEHIFRNATDKHPAIIFKSERNELQEISWQQLRSEVTSLQGYLLENRIRPGDRVVGFLPNIPEATTAFLAANSLGAVWSSCSPDFGIQAVIDRFAQVAPKVLITVDGYQYGGKAFDKEETILELMKMMPSLELVILIPYLDPDKSIDGTVLWEEVLKDQTEGLSFTPVPFAHPIWVLYSSGTTGIPKAITHSHGGILLEHLKYLAFHNDVKAGDRCFWYTTTGWMMWNYIQGCLLLGGTVVLYDGSPAYPDMNVLWQFAQDTGISHFGTSAGFVAANIKAATHPGKDFDLSALQSIGSTGSPLPPEGFDWIYNEIKQDLWLSPISGGTDVCSAFVGGNPLWPVYSGEMQCRALGCKLEAFNEKGDPVINEVGEMVISEPMPSMPIYFWNDKDYKRYTSSYFSMYPGKWRHGDWTMVTPRQGVVIFGRSDATLNRGGVRIGTSEIYRAVDGIPEVKDSIIVCLEQPGGAFYMPLFVELTSGEMLNEALKNKINQTIKAAYTPRHVPDELIAIPEVPYTISGKKVETPVKKILQGSSVQEAINPDALRNPRALDFFVTLSKKS